MQRIPKYRELADRLRQQIAAGELEPGHQLPSFAQMHAEYGIGQNTLERVYTLLERDGLIVRDPGRGTFVSHLLKASQSRGAKTGLIAVVAPHFDFKHPYYSSLMQGVQNCTRELGQDILLLRDAAGIHEKKFDGLIVHASRLDPTFTHILPGVPRVSAVYPQDGMATVCADDSRGTGDVVRYLHSQGHRRIAFLTGGCVGQADELSKLRHAGYCLAMQELGVAPEPGWVHYLYDPWTSRNYLAKISYAVHGRQKMQEWLQAGWEKLGCTALICQNDDTAIGVIEAFQEAGYKVPQDVSVVGFDGTERSEYFRPRLTTVHVPLQEIGEKSVQLLHQLIENPLALAESSARQVLVPTRLQVGESTACLCVP